MRRRFSVLVLFMTTGALQRDLLLPVLLPMPHKAYFVVLLSSETIKAGVYLLRPGHSQSARGVGSPADRGEAFGLKLVQEQPDDLVDRKSVV